MIKRVEKRTEKLKKSSLLAEYFRGLKVGFADIETTGLSPKTAKCILGGLVAVDSIAPDPDDPDMVNAELTCYEFFSDYGSKDDEKAVLTAYLEALRSLDVIVTYNGEHFDVPFLFERFNKYRIDGYEGFPFNFDLYRLLKSASSLKEVLPNLKQKTVESYYGLWPTRTDEISGADSVDLYYAYLSHLPGEGKDAMRETIILHNSDDCMQLCRLASIVSKTDFHRGLWTLGLPCGNLPVKKIYVKGDALHIEGRQRSHPVDYKAFDTEGHPFTVKMSRRFAEYDIAVPLQNVDPGQGLPKLKLLDLEAFSFDTGSIKDLPMCENQYIIVEEGGKTAYREVIAFVKLLLRDLEQGLG